jgi:hypothetical protein
MQWKWRERCPWPRKLWQRCQCIHSIPREASEVGACKDLEGHIFTLGSGNKGKDGDLLHTSMEKMATYIGTNYGNEAAQEWTSGKGIAPIKPAYSQVILGRHVARVKATRERIELRLKSLRAEKTAIEADVSRLKTVPCKRTFGAPNKGQMLDV